MMMVMVVSMAAFAAGDAAKGKILFNDPKFGGGTSGQSCNTCHPDGKGLETSGDKKEIKIMGKMQSLEDAVNNCTVSAVKGKAVDAKSEDMANLIAYIKSLKKPAEAPVKK